MGSGQLISVDPEELKFQFELEKQCYCDLKVVNKTEHHVAFKVKTTSPKKYFVRPNTGIIQPWDSCVVTVTLQAQREYPPDMQCRDKFLLQSTKVPPTTDIDEIPQDAFNKDDGKVIEERKLKVVYTTPSGSGHGNSESESLLSSSISRSSTRHNSDVVSMDFCSSVEDFQALQRLKEERDSARKQTQQLQQELEMLKRRRGRRSDEGFSLTFAAFVGLIGILFGFLLNFTLSGPPSAE
ncbi:vesicle-associated protein 2-1 [Magnolia sinica]|uniref:vesicle-associated protein 2-1 n=1 Tax=Magnolia sinica TaxID=86752 RepID=UPI002659C292|nr:vesicle-associated protein 2-1 [Magnolia sinica]